MFIVYKFTNPMTNQYYINYTSKELSQVLHKKLTQFVKNKEWQPYFIIFENDTMHVEKLCTFTHQHACKEFIKLYEHYNALCVNHCQNPKEFF